MKKPLTISRAQPSTIFPPVWVTYSVQEKAWILLDAYRIPVAPGITLEVPEGFRFDLASIPRPLWWIIAPFELSLVAPLGHDYLYKNGGKFTSVEGRDHEISRRAADKLFRNLMEKEGVPDWRVKSAYRAVRWFGGGSW